MAGKGLTWTEEMLAALKRLTMEGYTIDQSAVRMSELFNMKITFPAICHQRRVNRFLKSLLVPDTKFEIFRTLVIPIDNYLVTGDHHAPYHSELWHNRALMISDVFGIRKQILAGDFFDIDFAKFQYADERSTLEKEKAGTFPLIQSCSYFDENTLIRGNHEKRIGITTDSKIQIQHLFDYFGAEVWKAKFKFKFTLSQL